MGRAEDMEREVSYWRLQNEDNSRVGLYRWCSEWEAETMHIWDKDFLLVRIVAVGGIRILGFAWIL